MNNLIIGSHVSFNKNTQLLGSVEEALSYKANTYMFYTGAPQNTYRSEINEDLTKQAHELMKKNNIDINNVIVHAPYIVNLANNLVESKYQFSIDFLTEELKRCKKLGITKIVLHPGSHVKLTREEGVKNIINALNEIIKNTEDVTILLETMAGKGTEIGISIEEMKIIIDSIETKDRIGICLDTCHMNDAGYNINNFDEILNNFDETVGLEKVMAIHINDSKNEKGAGKDRHENFGFGTLGYDTLIKVIYNERIKDIPKILETPYITLEDKSSYPPYLFEIDMIREDKFNENLKEDIINHYQTK